MKIAYGLICLSFLISIGLNIFQSQQIKKLSRGVNQETSVNNESTGNTISGPGEAVQKGATGRATLAGKEKEPNKDEVNDLNYQLGAAEEEVDMANKQLSDELAKKAESVKNAIELQKKILQDPAYKKMLRDTYKGMLDTTYGPFFKELNLTPEKLGELKELLVDQVMASLDVSQETLGASPSEAKRAELQQRFEDLKKENDSKISALLGNTDFKKYETYRDRLSERQIVTMFTESLNPGDKLTEAQQQNLVNAMYQERKNVYSQQDYAENRMTFSSELDNKGIAIIMEMTDRTYMDILRALIPACPHPRPSNSKHILRNSVI